jgi:hypothetical protein
MGCDHRPPGGAIEQARAGRWKGNGLMNFMLIMKNEQSALVAIGPVALEYQAAMLRDEIEDRSNWTPVGIARVLTESQARELASPDQHASPDQR